jgi:hypothetical protein
MENGLKAWWEDWGGRGEAAKCGKMSFTMSDSSLGSDKLSCEKILLTGREEDLLLSWC